jgi:hypothetical protein
MYNHQPDRAGVVRISADGRRAIENSAPVERISSGTPAYFEEDTATNAALDAPDFGYTMADDTLDQEEQGPELDGIFVRLKVTRIRCV